MAESALDDRREDNMLHSYSTGISKGFVCRALAGRIAAKEKRKKVGGLLRALEWVCCGLGVLDRTSVRSSAV